MDQPHKRASETQVAGDHYRSMKIQPGYFCHQNGIGTMEGLAIKYICRHKHKAGAVDLQKAIHCLQLLLEWEYDTRGEGQVAGPEGTPPA
jgi:hypothetical protein